MLKHGGDIYRQDVELDFSVNGNPCGIPAGVKEALHRAVDRCIQYPDPEAEELCGALAERLRVPKEDILVGNGASELFPAIVRAVGPRKTVIPVPSFGGYEYAVTACTGEVFYYPLCAAEGFVLTEGIFSALDDRVDLLFLAQPGNPVGNLIGDSLLESVLKYCLKKGIRVVLDECFLVLTQEGEARSFVRRLHAYPNVLVVRAFTKTFAMPGVRLGYVACGDKELLGNVRRQLAEWSVSIPAQLAGIAALTEREYLAWSRGKIAVWREQLVDGLESLGMRVYPGAANFVFFRWEQEPDPESGQGQNGGYLYRELLVRKILIRDCSNYRGLSAGYYRAAVRTEAENRRFLQAVKEILEEVGKKSGREDAGICFAGGN